MKFYGELLVIILLLFANGRIIFLKNAKKDALVMLSPLAFILSIIQMLNWGLDVVIGLTLVLSVLVLLSNFHALFRYSERLYIDHYSVLMKIWASITIIFALALLAGTIYFKPVEYDNKKLGVEETVYRYEGSFRSGFEEASNIQAANLFLSEFKPQGKDTQRIKEVVLFIPDKRGDTYYYKPYLQHLAREGFVVLSADFFCSDCKWRHSIGDLKIARRTAMVIDYLLRPQKFMMQKEFYTYNIQLELNALNSLITERYGEKTKVFIVTDMMGTVAAQTFMEKNPEKVIQVYDLASIEEYKTSGFGIVAQTDPVLALLLEVPRDNDGFYTKYMVMQTKKEIMGSKKL